MSVSQVLHQPDTYDIEPMCEAEIFIRSNWRRMWIVFCWLMICATLFTWKFLQYKNRVAFQVMGYCLCTAKGSAETLKFNMALILLPVSRNTVTWLRKHRWINSVIPFNDNINFHKVITYFHLFGSSSWQSCDAEIFSLIFQSVADCRRDSSRRNPSWWNSSCLRFPKNMQLKQTHICSNHCCKVWESSTFLLWNFSHNRSLIWHCHGCYNGYCVYISNKHASSPVNLIAYFYPSGHRVQHLLVLAPPLHYCLHFTHHPLHVPFPYRQYPWENSKSLITN